MDMQVSSSGLQADLSIRQREGPPLRWTPFDLRQYLASREGKIWRHRDTLKLLDRAEQIDALIEQLLRAAGVQVVGSLSSPTRQDFLS
jgi:hypothetical protein